jgi:glycosyltransferase involved in cell wall biosynthesis
MSLFGGTSIQYLVLEHGIRARILQTLPSLAGKIEVLEHPLPPNESNSHTRKTSRPIHFGFVGLANEMKGFSTFLHLAAEMTTKHPGEAEFHVIGRLEPGADSRREMEFLATKPGLERLSRHEYIERVKRLHFIIMPYRLDYYELSPSGTLLDAIAWEVPVIASKLPIFERTFGDYGNVGYLFGNEKDLHAIVEDLVEEMDESSYAHQVSNLRKARMSRTPEKLAAVYREICSRGIQSQRRELGAVEKIA